MSEITVEVSIIRKDPDGGITVPLYQSVEATYTDLKAAHEDFELLGKMLKKFSDIPGS